MKRFCIIVCFVVLLGSLFGCSTEVGESKVTVALASEEQAADKDNFTHFYDESSGGEWKLIFTVNKKVKDFCFLELDESEKLKIADTLFSLDTFSDDSPLVVHTYINDATVNRGISFVDGGGETRYYGIYWSAKDGEISLKEITFDE